MATTNFQTVDEYISSFPQNLQEVLETIRRTIRDAVPEAQEKISYQMPTFTLDGKYLMYFSAWKEHIGFYAMPIDAFQEELAPYEKNGGTVKFPLDKPMPLGLISKITKYRAKENLERKKK